MEKMKETEPQIPQGTTEKKRGFGRATALIALCWIVYTCSYIGKLGYSANIAQIETLYGILHAEAGMVSTFFFFAYGAGQIFNGLFCRKYNLRFVVFGALIVSTLCNFGVGIAPDFSILKYLWLLNGAALSVLWPSLIRLLGESLDKKDSARAVVIMGTTVATGTLLIYGLSALFVALGSFKAVFFIAATLMPLVALVWLITYPKLVKKSQTELAEKTKQTEPKKTFSHGLLISVCIMALFAVVNNLVKDGLTTWVPTILIETYALPDSVSILLTLLLPMLAIFGTMVATTLHKKIENFVALCAVLFLAAAALIGFVIALLSTGVFVVTIVSFSLVSCLMAGVNNVITSMAPLFWKEKINSGLLAGILNGFCYVGSTISSYGLGSVADGLGWNGVFWLLFILCLAVVAIGFVYVVATKSIGRKKKKNNERT